MLLNKIIDKLESEATKYSLDAIANPGEITAVAYAKHHGYVEALNHAKQWITELLEEEDDDEDE